MNVLRVTFEFQILFMHHEVLHFFFNTFKLFKNVDITLGHRDTQGWTGIQVDTFTLRHTVC